MFEVSFPTRIIYNGTVYTLWSRIRDQEQGKQTRSIITSGQAHAPSIRTRNYLSTDLHFLFPECLHTARCSLLLPELGSYNKANVSIIYDTFYPDYLPRLEPPSKMLRNAESVSFPLNFLKIFAWKRKGIGRKLKCGNLSFVEISLFV